MDNNIQNSKDKLVLLWTSGDREVALKMVACKTCSDENGVSDKLINLGIDVKYMGQPLTVYLKEDVKLLTF